ncbi:MAG: hypothetical protein Q8L57_03915 [bacterium]|nr:hypothetical protein [bacterium]
MVFFKSKSIILTLVVIIGLAAGATLISKKEKTIEITTNKFGAEKNIGDFADNNAGSNFNAELNWEEKIHGLLQNLNPPAGEKKDPDNLTQRAAAALAEEIIRLNQNRDDNIKGLKVPKIREFVPDFLKEKLSSEEYDFLAGNDFDESRIKISRDNGKKSVQKYLTNFKSIIDRYFSFSDKLAKNIVRDAYKTGNFTEFDNLLLAYDGAIKEFYALSVPSKWADLHKEEIKLLISSKKVFEAFRRFENDPLKAKVAIRGYYLAAFRSLDLKNKINNKVAADKIWL